MDDIEAIRKRPGMYIGDVRDGSGLEHMVWELVANALDEHLAGRCTKISVELGADGSVSVEDDGRGFPLHDADGVPFAERALTSLHATPSLDGHAPHEHVALRGVGVVVVCALASRLELHVRREGRLFVQHFARGRRVSDLREIEPASTTGTRVTFVPDVEIFEQTWLNPGRIMGRLRELSFMLPKLSLTFADRREHVFNEPRGLAAYVDAQPYVGSRSQALAPFVASATEERVLVEVAARWGGYVPAPSIDSFANVARTTDGGTHVSGLLQGLATGFKRAAPQLCAGHSPKRIRGALCHGLTAVVCVRLDDPTFDSPTRSRLSTPEVTRAVRRCVAAAFQTFLGHQPDVLQHIGSRLSD